MKRLAGGVADQREVDAHDHGRAVGREEAPLAREPLGVARQHRAPAGVVGVVLVGMQQLVVGAPDELLLGAAAQLAERAVGEQQRAVGRGEQQTDRSALERAGEARLGLAQRTARVHALRNVAQHAREAALVVLDPAAERDLQRELAAVRAQPFELGGRAHELALAGGEEARDPRRVPRRGGARASGRSAAVRAHRRPNVRRSPRRPRSRR